MTKCSVESLESRRLLSSATAPRLAALDPSFGGGLVTLSSSGAVVVPSLTPIADGRVVTADVNRVRFLTANGQLDSARGVSGVLTLATSGTTVHAVTVDAATGRVAVLRVRFDQGLGDAQIVELYDANGTLINQSEVAQSITYAPTGSTLTFGRDGTLTVALVNIVLSSNSQWATEIYRFDDDLSPIESFSGDGVANFTYAPIGDHPTDSHFDAIEVDASGRVYLITFAQTNDGAGSEQMRYRVRRITAAGRPDLTYGTSSYATIIEQNSSITASVAQGGHHFDAAMSDAQIADDGTLTLAYYIESDSLQGGPSKADLLYRIDSAGVVSDPVTLAASVGGQPSTLARGGVHLATTSAATDAIVYASLRERGAVTRIVRFDPRINDVADTSSMTSVDLGTTAFAVDASGRVLLAGYRAAFGGAASTTLALLALTPSVDPIAQLAVGSVSIAVDGTVMIKGTDRADAIVVSRKGTTLTVELNGKRKTFATADVRAIAIRAGAGNDKVEAGQSIGVGVYADGGAGNDTIIGTDLSDTIVGGSGNDRLYGRGGADDLFGESGNDMVFGGAGADRLYGNAGDDRLYASDHSLDSRVAADASLDYLDAGAGRDLLVKDRGANRPGYDDLTGGARRRG